MSPAADDLYSGEAEILERAATQYESSNPDFPIDPSKTALLVIDLQEGFVATGSNTRIYGLNSGFLEAGRDADIVILDAPVGGTQSDALAAIKQGDIAAVGAVITDGIPRFVGRSRNSPSPMPDLRVVHCDTPQDFATARY